MMPDAYHLITKDVTEHCEKKWNQIWKWRNKSIHDDDFMFPERPWQVMVNYIPAYKHSLLAEEQIGHGRVQQQVNINWLAPPLGWFALNTNGAAKIALNIERFTKALRGTTAYMAELWGIYEGLRLAQRRELIRLELHTDSQITVQSLQDNKRGSNMGCTLMKKIRRLLNGPWEVQIIHAFRKLIGVRICLPTWVVKGLLRLSFLATLLQG
ncbi:hypothetical protein TSUD_394600 [Trifolium subterraneum]|uniref:RNase H type-1 domain-containing protein n=1 Tax=Trifolium subterraneum TaxID=3900 RepID=A0A2Z6NGX2_TRISU|nr:hypothetical protein TSUD_394600 [Trifolium subterraneum]